MVCYKRSSLSYAEAPVKVSQTLRGADVLPHALVVASGDKVPAHGLLQ